MAKSPATVVLQEPVRLQKILSEAGISSRREAERMIRDGEVTLNGKAAKVGDKAVLGKDHVKVRGKLLHAMPEKVVVAFFKPRDVVASNAPLGENAQPRGTIWEFLGRVGGKVYPVGRLDTDTEGLLLLTNDGDLSSRLTKSKFEVPKIYVVKIDGHIEDKKLKRLHYGVDVEDKKVRAEVQKFRDTQGKQWLRVTLTDPRNRMVRKIFEAVGHPVDKVRRDGFGSVSLKGLKRGQWRYLSADEITELRKHVGLGLKEKGK